MADRLSYWAQVLLIIGGLNVGVTTLGYNLMLYLPSVASTGLNYLVGLSALYIGYNLLTNK
ncbi:MAG: hypothetical protein CXT77_03830 [uncultured DHVE6 group euryarchaeote]|jgi:uncharacterized membrane protein YuzA (DUF378 family)|nr:MAG: hypothetical protein CXT77_03830 [uncultured DHVE6 group euryarchaeote]